MTNKPLHWISTEFVHQAEYLLKASDSGDKKRSSYESIPVACCRIDSEGFITDCNMLFAFLLGYEAEGLIHLSLFDLTTDSSDQLLRSARGIRSDNSGVFSKRVWMKTRSGSTFPAVLNISLNFDTGAKFSHANVVLIDDTFNHAKIAGIERDREEMRKKERLKNEFVAIASHELRTPIQPILGFALLAKRGSISQDAAWEGVLSEARRLQQLANDILDVSRIESDNLKYDFGKVRINELIRHTIDSLTTDAKEVKVVFDYPKNEADLVIDADRSRITQVISNIVGNAIKFSPQGTIRVETSVAGHMFEVRISDTGGGIPEDILPRLFEKFVTKDHGGGNKKGTGLGLYISKAIVAAHRGEISAFNGGGGATFVIRLPIAGAGQN